MRFFALVLLIVMAARGSAAAQEGAVVNAYVDPTYGWALSWNDDLSAYICDPGVDSTFCEHYTGLPEGELVGKYLELSGPIRIELENVPTIGDVRTCVDVYVQDLDQRYGVEILNGPGGHPLQGQEAQRAWTAYTYTARGTSFASYVECRPLVPGSSTLRIKHLIQGGTDARGLIAQTPDREALLARLILPGFYASPVWGFSFAWDPAIWAIVPPSQDTSATGQVSFVDGLTLTDGTGVLVVSGAADYGGDSAACVASAESELGATPVVAEGGAAIAGETAAGGRYAVYTLPADPELPGQWSVYVECRPLRPSEAVIVGLYFAPTAQFNDGAAAAVTVLDSLQLAEESSGESPGVVDPRGGEEPAVTDPRATATPAS
jgi:hypothetical protein